MNNLCWFDAEFDERRRAERLAAAAVKEERRLRRIAARAARHVYDEKYEAKMLKKFWRRHCAEPQWQVGDYVEVVWPDGYNFNWMTRRSMCKRLGIPYSSTQTALKKLLAEKGPHSEDLVVTFGPWTVRFLQYNPVFLCPPFIGVQNWLRFHCEKRRAGIQATPTTRESLSVG